MSRGAHTHGTFALFALVVTVVLVAATAAIAAGPYVTLDDPAPAVEEVDGGGYKLEAGLTN
jgi:hypothetical protein